jgi:hypothetical protein
MSKIPAEHRATLTDLVNHGDIIDFEADGVWDPKASNGPGRTFGKFENAVEDDGAHRYFVWLEAPKDES